MSTPDRRSLEARLSNVLMQWQDATQRFDEAVGRRLDLNPAERRCLALLVAGPQVPSVLAEGVGLTRSAMTALVDRLEARGLVVRQRSDRDRRQVLVQASGRARDEVMALYRPLAEGAPRCCPGAVRRNFRSSSPSSRTRWRYRWRRLRRLRCRRAWRPVRSDPGRGFDSTPDDAAFPLQAGPRCARGAPTGRPNPVQRRAALHCACPLHARPSRLPW